MSEAPPNPSDRATQSGPAEGANGQPDPLANLHRMSRTAGLGSQEYVAVNPTAVASVLLGIASLLAVLGSVLLVIPVAAVIVGIVALIQVKRSAGTQTGKGIAILGMLLALLCVGLAGGRKYMHKLEVAREQGQIVALIQKLGEHISKEEYDAAWDLFSDTVHQGYTKSGFINYWTRAQEWEGYGRVTSMEWNGILNVSIDPEGATLAEGIILIHVNNPSNPNAQDRRPSTFRKLDNGEWVVEDMGIDFGAAEPAGPEPPRQQ